VRNALLRWAHGPAIRLADHLICVSEKHADDMAERYQYDRARITVVPNGADVSRFRPDPDARAAIRKQLGLADDELVIVYSGGMNAWQCFPESVDFTTALAGVRGEVHLLVLTPDLGLAQQHLKRTCPPLRHHALTVSHHEVPRYLAAADAGLLLRAPNACNVVASPMKFAEYLACGLPVVIGPEVGDYSDLVRTQRLGVVLHPGARDTWKAAACELLALLAESPDRASTRCREVAANLLSSEVERARFGEAIDRARAARSRGTPGSVSV
jgi:glycosyltransferase involved in cell wall biosynthesis